MVRDNKSGEVVGTYRMMGGAQARQLLGFYSEKEFDLSRIKKLDGELLELGGMPYCWKIVSRLNRTYSLLLRSILQHKSHGWRRRRPTRANRAAGGAAAQPLGDRADDPGV
jgi:hypothetical protein